jgi:anti-sigma factor RsiW
MSPTSCDDFRAFIDPYLDGEFDDRERANFDAHLSACPSCREFFEHNRWIQNAVKPSLRQSCQLSAEARGRLESKLRTVRRPTQVGVTAKRLAKPVSAVALVAAAVVFIIPLTGFKSSVVDEVVDQHCQVLPVELPTPEVREVDDWFADKLPFRVAAPRFRDQRVTLMGGRLSRIHRNGEQVGSTAAQIVYRVGEHKMSVLVFRAKEGVGSDLPEHVIDGNRLRMLDSRGHRVALIRRGNLTYAVTSTLPKAEMLGLLGQSL